MITFRKHFFSICAVSAIAASSFAIAGPAEARPSLNGLPLNGIDVNGLQINGLLINGRLRGTPAQVQTVKAAPVISFDPVAEGFEPYTEPMEAAVISTDPVADGFHIKAQRARRSEGV